MGWPRLPSLLLEIDVPVEALGGRDLRVSEHGRDGIAVLAGATPAGRQLGDGAIEVGAIDRAFLASLGSPWWSRRPVFMLSVFEVEPTILSEYDAGSP
jgi:hypothetical protein